MFLIFKRVRELQATRKSSALQVSKQYRTLQVLGTIMNGVQQKVWITYTIVGTIMCQCLSFSLVIKTIQTKSYNHNLILLGVFSVVGLNDVLLLSFLVGGMAQVMEESHKLIRQWKKPPSTLGIKICREKLWESRFVKGCDIIKVRFGALNFIDKVTPLNCLDFANEITVHILLIAQ